MRDPALFNGFIRKLKLGIANGRMLADGEEVFTTQGMKVGLFTD
ncbi:MAG: hypothetical protein AAF585_24530 [Verrucomicrobiota bacterium]